MCALKHPYRSPCPDPGLLYAHLKDAKVEEGGEVGTDLFGVWSPHLNSVLPEDLESIFNHCWRGSGCL